MTVALILKHCYSYDELQSCEIIHRLQQKAYPIFVFYDIFPTVKNYYNYTFIAKKVQMKKKVF